MSNRCTVRIDDGVKREILARTDIGEVIGAVVSLRKRGNDSSRPVPVSRRENAVVPRPSRSRLFQVFRLRCGRRRDSLRAVARQPRFRRGDARAREAGRDRTRERGSGNGARAQRKGSDLSRQRRRRALLPPRADDRGRRRSRPPLLRRARHQRDDDRDVRAGLRSGALGRFGRRTAARGRRSGAGRQGRPGQGRRSAATTISTATA